MKRFPWQLFGVEENISRILWSIAPKQLESDTGYFASMRVAVEFLLNIVEHFDVKRHYT